MSSSQHEAGPAPNTGLVVRKLRNRFDVDIQGRVLSCTLDGSPLRSGPPLVVGDLVALEAGADGGGRILELLPRRNQFGRRAAGPRPVEQVVAANLDWVAAVFAAAQPRPKWSLLDRYLVAAESSGIRALVLITKWDLLSGQEKERTAAELSVYEDLGYPVVFTSSETGEGIEEAGGLLHDKLTLLAGKSGVGKTSLIRALTGREDLRVQQISNQTGKGLHTTVDQHLVRLPSGGALVDTPGVREFALWDVPAEEVADCFPEMRDMVAGCRFAPGCTHSHEPDCAVKAAVQDGRIHPDRYRSYLKLAGLKARGDLSPAPYKHAAKNQRSGPARSEGFTCAHCGAAIPADPPGTAHRNHCPDCLWSLHVDRRPGDRAAGCSGQMEPIAVSVRPDGEWTLVHRCRECGEIKVNRIAGDDNGYLLLSLAARPLARPPFPLDRILNGPWDRKDGLGELLQNGRTLGPQDRITHT